MKCLGCHSELRTRIEARRGLHAQLEYADCQLCHVEHQGREFSLVYWKGGEESFDHSLTGYSLRGKHATAACRGCHRPDYVVDSIALLRRQKDLAHTFLGLDTGCVSCHFDEHRAQLPMTCSQCHTFVSWAPAPGFDHSKTDFGLTGRHASTACAQCHQKITLSVSSGDREYLRFAGVAHEACIDCHADVHGSRFGLRCEGCHSTNGWQVADHAGFDHNKTRYPLEGRHKFVACDKCHASGKPKSGVRFQNCLDCHKDHHAGEFTDRAQRGACEECHTVTGFAPSLFTMEKHQATGFVLRGAHLAVSCIQCHTDAPGAFPTRVGRYTWASTRCQDCHRDVHRGQLAKFVEHSGCEYCHSENAWSQIRFAHDSTRFPLQGKHTSLSCASCHRGDSGSATSPSLTFAAIRCDCESCHHDTHRGQFTISDTIPRVRCERCHTYADWRPTLFDHSTMTDYPLEGAHAPVPCEKCHTPTESNGQLFVDYHITDRSCRSCHASDDFKGKGEAP